MINLSLFMRLVQCFTVHWTLFADFVIYTFLNSNNAVKKEGGGNISMLRYMLNLWPQNIIQGHFHLLTNNQKNIFAQNALNTGEENKTLQDIMKICQHHEAEFLLSFSIQRGSEQRSHFDHLLFFGWVC